MTSQFWKWLSRANARTALLAAAIALAVVAAYWVWRELEPEQESSVFPGRLNEAGPGLTNRVELLAFIEAQKQNGEQAVHNPFFRRPLWKPEPHPPKPPPPPGGKPETRPEVKPKPKPPPPQPPPPPPPPPRPVKEIPVLFRGILIRPDGARVALIEEQETKKQRFYEAGQPFMGGTVGAVLAETVVLLRAGGAVALPRGEVVRLREE